MSHTNVSPSRWYYGLAGLVVFVGVASFLWLLFHSLSGLSAGLTQMVVPGEHQLELAEAGSYTVFHEFQSVVDDRVFSATDAGLAGLKCSLRSQQTDEIIPLAQPTGNSTYSIGARSGTSVLQFTVDAPGTYTFSAEYPAGQDGPEVVLAVGHGFVGELLAAVFGGLAIMFVTMGGAAAIVIITFVKRRRAQRHRTSEQTTAPLE